MKLSLKKAALLVVSFLCFGSTSASAQQLLTGNTKTACEVILCFAAVAGRPSECVPPITKFLLVKPWKRLNFLKLCPAAQQNNAYVDKIVNDNLLATDPVEFTIGTANVNGEIIRTANEAKVLTCGDLQNDPAWSKFFMPPTAAALAVPNGYVSYDAGGNETAIAVDGYNNEPITYQNQVIGYGAYFVTRFVRSNLTTGAVSTGAWGSPIVPAWLETAYMNGGFASSPWLFSCNVNPKDVFEPARGQ